MTPVINVAVFNRVRGLLNCLQNKAIHGMFVNLLKVR